MQRTTVLFGGLVLMLASCGGETEVAGSRSSAPSITGAESGSPEVVEADTSGPQTITLLSGQAPLPKYTIENGQYAGETGEAPGQDLSDCHGHNTEMYAEMAIMDTRWVSLRNDCKPSHATGDAGRDAVYTNYDVKFTLPQSFTKPSIAIQVLAADQAEVFLNKTSLGAQDLGTVGSSANWISNALGAPFLVNTKKASLFRPGVNALRFRVLSTWQDHTGVDYSAVVNYSV